MHSNSIIGAAEGNHNAFFSRFGRSPAGELITRAGVTAYSSGIDYPIFNGAMADDVSVPDHAIRETVSWFRNRRLPFLWWVMPSQRGGGLVPRLEAAGLHKSSEPPSMVLPLDRLEAPAPPADELRVERVGNERGLEVFASTLNSGDFEAPDRIAASLPRLLRPEPGDSRLALFLGYVRDEPVATSLRFLANGVVGIYGIATVPKARRRGIGAAMTYAALIDGRKAADASFAVLSATRLGRPVYQRLGFVECGKFEVYTPAPGEADW